MLGWLNRFLRHSVLVSIPDGKMRVDWYWGGRVTVIVQDSGSQKLTWKESGACWSTRGATIMAKSDEREIEFWVCVMLECVQVRIADAWRLHRVTRKMLGS